MFCFLSRLSSDEIGAGLCTLETSRGYDARRPYSWEVSFILIDFDLGFNQVAELETSCVLDFLTSDANGPKKMKTSRMVVKLTKGLVLFRQTKWCG